MLPIGKLTCEHSSSKCDAPTNVPFISFAISFAGISSDEEVLRKFENAGSLNFGLVAEYPMRARSIDGMINHRDTSIVGPDEAGPIMATLPR